MPNIVAMTNLVLDFFFFKGVLPLSLLLGKPLVFSGFEEIALCVFSFKGKLGKSVRLSNVDGFVLFGLFWFWSGIDYKDLLLISY